MLESLREKWGLRAIRKAKRQAKTARELIPLDEVRHVQLVVPSDNLERFNATVELGRQLATSRRRVQVISVCLEKHPDDRLLMREGVVLFTRSSVSWLYKPNEPLLFDVTAPRPDLLVDFSLQPDLTLQWIAYFSRANIKIGFSEFEGVPIHDITFAMKEGTNIQDQFNVLQQYLSKLSGQEAKEAMNA